MAKPRAALAHGLYRASNGLLGALQRLLWPRKRPSAAERVCIYRIGNIGDILCAVPAMRAIREAYPDSRLTLLTSPGTKGMPGAQDLLEGADWLDEIWVYSAEEIDSLSKRRALAGRLRERRFDVWIELPNDLATWRVTLRNMALARWVGARWAAGWRISTIRWSVQAQSLFLSFPNEVDRLLSVTAQMGIPAPSVFFPLPIQDRHRRAVDDLLERHGLSGRSEELSKGHPLLALAPGAKKPLNRWPLERFAHVGAYAVQKGFSVLLVGGPEDRESCLRIARGIGEGASSVAGECSLLESLEILRRCRLLVCNDSGVQHMAAAVGTPSISLFSFWQLKGKWHPYGLNHTVLQKWVDCHTCYLERCPYDNRCINLNEVAEVTSLIDTLGGAA